MQEATVFLCCLTSSWLLLHLLRLARDVEKKKRMLCIAPGERTGHALLATTSVFFNIFSPFLRWTSHGRLWWCLFSNAQFQLSTNPRETCNTCSWTQVERWWNLNFPLPAIKVVRRMFTQNQITGHYSHNIRNDERIICCSVTCWTFRSRLDLSNSDMKGAGHKRRPSLFECRLSRRERRREKRNWRKETRRKSKFGDEKIQK